MGRLSHLFDFLVLNKDLVFVCLVSVKITVNGKSFLLFCHLDKWMMRNAFMILLLLNLKSDD